MKQEFVCIVCGNKFGRYPSQISTHGNKYCSGKCRTGRTAEERFWAKVKKSDGCWEWQGSKLRSGHGTFKVNHVTEHAHRWIYELVHGELPDDILVCHHCDNPPCVRDDHLFSGTKADNAQDMARKGRGVFQQHPEKVSRGEKHGMSKLTDDDVREMRRLRLEGIPAKELALRYNINQTYVFAVLTGKVWRHIG